MDAFRDTQDIFEQLARTDGSGGVKTIIENHDAWTHNTAIEQALSAAVISRLAHMPRDPAREARIERQRHALASLSVRLKSRYSSAG